MRVALNLGTPQTLTSSHPRQEVIDTHSRNVSHNYTA